MSGRWRWAPSALAAALALVLAACGEGERIPVVPGFASLDQPPDPHFITLVPICAEDEPRAAIWTGDDYACVVGTRGLVVSRTGDAPWWREPLDTASDLLALVADGRGNPVAVGENGIVAERSDGAWTLGRAGPGGSLRALAVAGDEVWAVGDDGVLLRRAGPGRWTRQECPTAADLADVCARGDTLVVCGAGGVVLQRAGGHWTDLQQGDWADHDVRSVASLPAGPVWAVADSVYEFDGVDWAAVPLAYAQAEEIRELQARHGAFWLTLESSVRRYTATDGTWLDRRFYGSTGIQCAAPLDADTLLIATASGDLIWNRDGQRRDDPAGANGRWRLVRFEDGQVGAISNSGVLGVGRAGIRLLHGLEDAPSFYKAEACVGRSPDDLYMRYGSDLYHFRDGLLASSWELDNPFYNWSDLALDPDGFLYASSRAGLFRLVDGALRLELGDEEVGDEIGLVQGLAGTMLAWSRRGIWRRQDGQWHILTTRGCSYCAELPDGTIVAVVKGDASSNNKPDLLLVWREGAGVFVEREAPLVPGSRDIWIQEAVQGPDDLYVYTDRPSRVFRLAGDPLAPRWEPVAGPLDGEIEQMVVLDDGSLLVHEGRNDHILLRRPR